MDCLLHYIGIRAAGQPQPESGLYINDLPGITLAQLSDINNSDQAAFTDLFSAVERRSARLFETAFTNAMSRKYRLRSMTEAYKLSETIDPAHSYAPISGELRGLYIKAQVPKSAFHHLPLGTVRLYLTAAADLDLKIYSVEDDDLLLLDTFSLSGTEGWNDIRVNKKYHDTRSLFIAYDASTITSPSLPLDSLDLDGYSFDLNTQYLSPISISGATYSEEQFTSRTFDTYGISASISLACSYDTLVCNYRSQLAVAWWYLLGSELMRERIYTDRINRYTTIDLDKARELMQTLHDDYLHELQTFVDSIDLHRDRCIDCDAQVKQVDFLP
jgi:hypothetical protein